MLKHEAGDAKKRFFEAMKGLKGAELQVGFFSSAKYPDENQTSVAYVAAIHEFGSPKNSIPPRPFFRPTITAREKAWKNAIARNSRQILAGNITAVQALDVLGLSIAGDIKKTISKIKEPPLSFTTLLLRKWRKEHKSDDGSLLKVTGKTVGEAARLANFVGPVNDKSMDVSGVSTKPLVDTGLLIASVTHEVTQK